MSPDTRQAINHKFNVGGHEEDGGQENYLTVELDSDNKPIGLFWTVSKNGSTLGGMADVIGRLVGRCLQSGVPLDKIAADLQLYEFEPCGRTSNPDIPWAKSLPDYVGKWLEYHFGEHAKKRLEFPKHVTESLKLNGENP